MEDWQKQLLELRVGVKREFDAVLSRINRAEAKMECLEAELDALKRALEKFHQNRIVTVEKKIDILLDVVGDEKVEVPLRDFVAWKAGE